MKESHRPRQSHGTGEFQRTDFCALGEGVVFEAGVLVFHPANIEIGKHVYIGHYTILKGYYKNKMVIGEGTWIGNNAFFIVPAGC
jgi:acetyltransferase-like isoleucine patch superfamily enzyme